MATVNKDFRVKNGLVVEGSTATVNGSNVLTESSTEFLQDTTASMLVNGSQSGITFTYNDTTGVIDAAVSTTPTFADKIIFEGATEDSYETTLQVVDPTADRTITLPDVNGTVITTGDTGTVTNTMLAGSISNDKLSNSAITINGTSVSLGGTRTLGTDDVSEGSTNKYFTDERAQDAVGNALGTGLTYNDGTGAVSIDTTVTTNSGSQTLTNKTISGSDNTISNIGNSSLTNSSITINGTSVSLGGTRTLGTDDVSEGSTNKYFTDERAQDAIGAAIAAGTQTNISVTYDDSTNSLSFNASGGVSSLAGTSNEVEVSSSTGAVTIGLPDNVTLAGNLTINGTPSDAHHAATKEYVDAATFGLNVHDAVKAATTTSINLSTDLENGDTLDGVTLATGQRVLVKNQGTKSQNGIYIVAASGAASRAADYDTAGEVDAGDFVFVEGGTVNGKTGWVQTNAITTLGSDDIEFTQFSGAGTYLAGNGLTLTGNSFSINTGTTVDVSTAQTLTNKTLTSPTVSGLYLSDNNITIEGTNDTNETTLTFTDPTQDNTITFKDASGTLAFTSDIPSNTDGLSEGSTNKYFTDERAQDAIASAISAGTQSNISITYDDSANSLSFSGASQYTDEMARDAIGSALTAGTGIGISVNDGDDTITVSNTGVTSLTGTTDQVTASASTGSVTLSLPQSINTTSTPTFGGVTVGSVTLTDALLGTATQALTSGSATVIDTWSASSYSSAKYVVQMKKDNDIEVIEVLVTVDGNNNVYLTEYADVISNTQIGTTDADYSGGNVRLLVTASNGTTVKVHKTLIEA